MHSRTATLFALICVTALVTGCEVDQPLAPVTGTAPLASAAASQKVPTDLALTASPGEIALAWRDNSPNETAFQVLRSTTGQTGAFTTVATTAANVTTYSDPGPDPKQQYCYKIQAVAQKRILGVSNTACAIPQPLQPIAASNVDAQPTSTADIPCRGSSRFSGSPNGASTTRTSRPGTCTVHSVLPGWAGVCSPSSNAGP